MIRFDLKAFGIAIGVVSVALAAACGSGEVTPGSDDPSGGFISGDPSGPSGPGSGVGGSAGSAGGGGSGGGAGTGSPPDDPAKAIEEADIVQLQNGRLYALSQYGGLTVIDAQNADALSVLGRHRLEAIPFEMYVKSGIVFAMFTSWSSYVEWQGSWQYVSTSYLVALDATNPANIVELAKFQLPGVISDSRIVGDVLYLVSHEDGYCYGCKSTPNTTVVSLDVSVPSAPKKVDELVFDGGAEGWSYKKSITVNEDRMYVAGPEWSSTEGSSTIQVIDISDPAGDLVLGAAVPAAGWIESRWQMDEHDGVLRVISQPPWAGSTPPTIQTFTVTSAQEITPLASVDMVLPVPENLRSVRFDGPRAYAITFQQTDPLFTIDLSDPANPKQMGELVMPGWVYHMEPRGDRVLGIGFDQTSTEGSLNVSLFDVSDMTTPKLVDRVNFGGDWGEFAEDQDRVHKAFRIIDALGLILVPYSAWNYRDGYYCGSSESGVQLVDFTTDDLTLRGVASSSGRARRAFVEESRLFTVSDERVQTFDITNRDAPQKKSSLRLAHVVTQTQTAGNQLVRLGNNWWTDSASLDVVPRSGAAQPDLGTSVDLAELLGETTSCNVLSSAQLFTHDHFAYVVYGSGYAYTYYYGYDVGPTKIAVFDIASGTPVLVGKVTLPDSAGSHYGYGYGHQATVDGGKSVVQYGSTLALHRAELELTGDASAPISHAFVDVVDLKNPAKIQVSTIARPAGPGHTALSLAGSIVTSSHYEPVSGQPGKVRFYLDRIDIANGSAPQVLAKINVPGSLLSIDPASKRAITVDYEREVETGVTYSECYAKWGYGASFVPDDYESYDYSNAAGTCTMIHRSFELVDLHTGAITPYATLVDSSPIADGQYIGSITQGADRTFVGTSCYGCSSSSPEGLEIVSGLATGKLGRAHVSPPPGGGYYYSMAGNTIDAQATRAVFTAGYPEALFLLDATNATAPSLTKVHTFASNAYNAGLELDGNEVFCSLGNYGVEVVKLAP